MLRLQLLQRPFTDLSAQQTLVSHAIRISQRYTGDQAPAYRAAAESLRVAYWDWAANSTLPDIITHDSIKVNGPSGPINIQNPLHSYWFQNYPFNIQYMNAGVLSRQSRTTRCPTKNLDDDVAKVNAGLAASEFKAQVVRI